MISFKTVIVGLKHRQVDRPLLEKILRSNISFQKEPTNPFDPFAVQCISAGYHFGYIEGKKAKEFGELLERSSNYKIDISSYDEYKIHIGVDFVLGEDNLSLAGRDVEFVGIDEGNAAGIYEISFLYNHQRFCYVGQSININSRLRRHYRELSSSAHHNNTLQEAWAQDHKAFDHRILIPCPSNLDGFDRQVFLFRKEIASIENSDIPTVNKISADLVLTEDSALQLRKIVSRVKSRLKVARGSALIEKEKIGQKIIDAGIMKEERFWDGWQRGGQPDRYLTVKASNVLTWMNKTRYGMMDRRPPIDRDHPLYKQLHAALNSQQQKVAAIDSKKKFVDDFLRNLEDKGKYELCELKKLDHFLNIVDEYLKEV